MKWEEKFRLYRFMEKVAEDVVSEAGIEIRDQSMKGSAGRLMGTDHHAYRMPARVENKQECYNAPARRARKKQSITPENPPKKLPQCTASSAMWVSAWRSVLIYIIQE
jgi:hypothetical protein